ncbi:Probable L-asparagine permease 1 (transport protein) [Mycobacteroides abscessus subsp. massiliense]|nr:Probable L-asparagine permease 1 (transport protein) [Mycobacteroides abscessus subsp. massiliense]
MQRGKFQMPGAPYTGYATLIFLLVVLVLMCYENYWNLVALGIFTPLLIIGWYLSKERVMQLARERVGYTGQYPVIAETPMMDDPPNLGDK